MGKGGGGQVTGYRYLVGQQHVLGIGEADAIRNMRAQKRHFFVGKATGSGINATRAQLFGGPSREGGISGRFGTALGSMTQAKNGYLAGVLAPVDGRIPAYRGVISVILEQVEIGLNPYMKPFDYVVQRILKRADGSDQWYPSKAAIRRAADIDEGNAVVTTTTLSSESPDAAETATEAISSDLGVVVLANEGDVLRIVPTSGGSNFWGTISVPTFGYVWRVAVIRDEDPNDVTTFSTFSTYGARATQAEATADAIALAANNNWTISGGTSYRFVIIDDPVADNDGDIGFSVYTGGWTDLYDMNPAHILRDCLQDPVWGQGFADSRFDSTWETVADTLYAEGFGLSFQWNRDDSIADFMEYVLSHIDATVFVDPFTGKWSIKLIRDDYDEGSLPIVGEDDILALEDDLERVDPLDAINQVVVIFSDPLTGNDRAVTVNDPVLIAEAGAIRPHERVDYRGVHEIGLASRLAYRDLASLSSSLLKGSVMLNRLTSLQDLLPGSAFKLQLPRFGIDEICRVVSFEPAGPLKNKVKVTLSSDVYALTDLDFVSDAGWDGALGAPNAPIPVVTQYVEEAPYWLVAQVLGDTEAESRIADDLEIGYLAIAAPQPVQDSFSAEVYTDEGSTGTYARSGILQYSPSVNLIAAVTAIPTDTSWTIENIQGGSGIESGTLAIVGSELISIETVNILTGAMTVKRGCLDTIPQAHAADTPVFALENVSPPVTAEYVAGQTVDVKLLPITPLGTLDISESSAGSVTLNQRAARPFPAGDFNVDGYQIGETIPPLDGSDVVLTWATRNRLTQTGATFDAYTAGDIALEAGATFTVVITYLDETGADVSTAINTSVGTAKTYTWTGWTAPAGAFFVKFEVRSVRDGLNEYQTPTIVASLAVGYGDGYGTAYGG